jgi:plastocyanin
MQNSTLVVIILIALGVLGVGWFLFMNDPLTPTTIEESANSGVENTNTNESAGGTETGTGAGTSVGVAVGASTGINTAPMMATVTYSASGYSPSSVTIKKGGTVTWVDQGTSKMWTASASHPTHTFYSGTTREEHCDDTTDISFDQCKNSSQYTFTFDKVGTWRYHNHSQSSHFGSVTVVE